ncbi:unnamed protein product [Vitrella brassicaformis CCMP3155]|uniref:Uncharacterized protein n=1 Tax=Vitrella brassicaformis (strain CCMP3155) TaxID=1169540 RepID=A0A0G4H456_VITBC|nr:unnamed protein product [Vitrella brassicaformis CCMP3155]|eukprot:CEM38355.1 unnamed protein product [Vitrella brassicaformis CCMP3155]
MLLFPRDLWLTCVLSLALCGSTGLGSHSLMARDASESSHLIYEEELMLMYKLAKYVKKARAVGRLPSQKTGVQKIAAAAKAQVGVPKKPFKPIPGYMIKPVTKDEDVLRMIDQHFRKLKTEQFLPKAGRLQAAGRKKLLTLYTDLLNRLAQQKEEQRRAERLLFVAKKATELKEAHDDMAAGEMRLTVSPAIFQAIGGTINRRSKTPVHDLYRAFLKGCRYDLNDETMPYALLSSMYLSQLIARPHADETPVVCPNKITEEFTATLPPERKGEGISTWEVNTGYMYDRDMLDWLLGDISKVATIGEGGGEAFGFKEWAERLLEQMEDTATETEMEEDVFEDKKETEEKIRGRGKETEV